MPNRAHDLPPNAAPRRTPRQRLGVYLRGLAMGCADVVPGVSGGTMALILGIYEELILSLKALGSRDFWQALLGLRLAAAFRLANGGFLLALAAGIFTALLLLSRLILWLLAAYPLGVYSFFFGLILASSWLVGARVSRWTPSLLALLVASALGAFWLVGLSPSSTPNTPLFVLLSGAFAICAMILPGISGAFILVLLGKYEYILGALSRLDLGVIFLFGLGALVGLVSFAQVLGWLFRRHRDLTLALLTGFMLGSLRKVWPWQAAGVPLETGVLSAALLMLAGALAVLGLERLGAGR